MNSETGSAKMSLAEALVDEAFPALSQEEELVLVDYLGGLAGEQERAAAEALLASSPDLAAILARAQGQMGENAGESLTRLMREAAGRKRREQILGAAWEKLRDLGRQFGEALDLEAFRLEDFELAGAMLGGGEGGELFPENLVAPLAGESGARTSFTLRIPEGASSVEFEVIDREGQLVEEPRHGLVSGQTYELPFAGLGMREGQQYEWCLTFSDAEGAYQVRSGTVIPSAPEKRGLLERLLTVAARETDAFRQELLKCVLFFHHEVYDALLEKLRSLYERENPGEERRQVLLMLQRSYRKLRQYLAQNGFAEDSDRILERIAAAERELQEAL